MTNAPSVNQMRFLSSSALAKADQLMLAASCSAADAIGDSLRGGASGPAPYLQHALPPADADVGGSAPSIWSWRAPMPSPRDWRSGGRWTGLLTQHLEAAACFLD